MKVEKEQYDALMQVLTSKQYDYLDDMVEVLEPISIFSNNKLESKNFEFFALLFSIILLHKMGIPFNSGLSNLDTCRDEIRALMSKIDDLQRNLDVIYNINNVEGTAEA